MQNSESSVTLKFGGTSMCPDGFFVILDQIKKYNDRNIFIVVSATKNTTNNLFKIANHELNTYETIYNQHIEFANTVKINKDLLNKTLEELKSDIDSFISDFNLDIIQKKIKIISYGEILSSILLYEFLLTQNINIKLLNSRNFIKSAKTSVSIDTYNLNLNGAFYCDKKSIDFVIEPKINVYLMQGYIASTQDNKYCILSRSGSDTSSALVASAMQSTHLEIWTDVNGMYSADPRYVKNAKCIEKINYNLCQEISTTGSYILHPFCIKPCQEKNIPIHIRNTFNPNSNVFTIITKDTIQKSNNVYAISVKKNVTIFKIESLDMWEGEGFVSDIFSVFTKNNISVDIITTSQFSITTTTCEQSDNKIQNVCNLLREKYDVQLNKNCDIISIVADDVLNNNKIHNTNFQKLKEKYDSDIQMIHYSSNNLTLSLVINNNIKNIFVNELHKCFFE
jgi:aspartokinase/homoserine dehydrogenase 1